MIYRKCGAGETVHPNPGATKRIAVAAAYTAAVLFILPLTGCTSAASNVGMAQEARYQYQDTGFEAASAGTYDSSDTAVVEKVNRDLKEVTFMNIETGRSYTLSYDGATTISDKYGAAMSMDQIKEGDISDILFLKSKKKLADLKLSADAWTYSEVKKYSLDERNSSAAIGDGIYSLHGSTVVVSEGQPAEVADIIAGDVLSIGGIGHNIYSVVVEKGHGYLRLDNDEYLLDGWIEVGQAVIQQITQDMLLAVPEGTYDVHVTNDGVDETRTVTIERDKETVLDLGDIESDAAKTGKVIITVMPNSAAVYLDGEKRDISKPIELEYGLHRLEAKAGGYDTISQYIKVSKELANLNIEMEESDGSPDRSSSVSGNDLSVEGFRIYVDAPAEAEVYFDNNYMGISPVSFPKQSGSHVITLRKTGYVTKSYTLQIDDDEKDVTYSFTDLEKEAERTGNVITDVPGGGSGGSNSGGNVSGNHVSGNDVSGNSVSGNDVSGNSVSGNGTGK